MSIRSQTPPDLVHRPTVDFDVNAFDALLWNKGYNILHEESRVCPCRSRESGSALSTCENCRGFGFFFLNPIKTKAIVTNINQNPKYNEWSVENAGTIYASMLFANILAEYDRITFTDVVTKWSENLKVRTVDGQQFIFLTYKPHEILDIFVLATAREPLIKLTAGTDYEISSTNDYIVLLNFVPLTGFNSTIAITYLCHSQYHIIDLPHALRASTLINTSGQNEKVDLPVQAVLRRAHLVLGGSDAEGGIQTIDNSYK
jgi:hypothetical protein